MTAQWMEGAPLPPRRMGPVRRKTLTAFADASGDRNPIHLDAQAARAVGLPEVIAHGMLSMAYLGRYLTSQVDQRDLVSFEVRFEAVTPLGAEPICQATVDSVVEEDGRVHADLDLLTSLADGIVTLRGRARTALPGPTTNREELP